MRVFSIHVAFHSEKSEVYEENLLLQRLLVVLQSSFSVTIVAAYQAATNATRTMTAKMGLTRSTVVSNLNILYIVQNNL